MTASAPSPRNPGKSCKGINRISDFNGWKQKSRVWITSRQVWKAYSKVHLDKKGPSSPFQACLIFGPICSTQSRLPVFCCGQKDWVQELQPYVSIIMPSTSRQYDQGPNGHWRIQKRASFHRKVVRISVKIKSWCCMTLWPRSSWIPPPFVWLLWTDSLVSWCLVDSRCAKIIQQRSVETQMWILNGLPVKKIHFRVVHL